MGNNHSLNLTLASEETARCLLCHDAPCSEACPKEQAPDRLVRSLRFENLQGAARHMADCGTCSGPCENTCIALSGPLKLRRLGAWAREQARPAPAFPVSLATEFCGIPCENPFFLSSSVVASNYEMCARALEMGWAGVVFKTIGVLKPREVSPRFDAIGKEGTPFVGFRNLEQISDHTLEDNLSWLRELKRDFPSKVIVASIMGQDEAEWTYLARVATEAGVDIIECNFSCPQMVGEGLGSDVGQNPDLVRRYTAATRAGTHLPILAKMTPNLGRMEIPAIAAMEGGADGLAAINTVKSLTGLDLETVTATPSVAGHSSVSGYSGKAIKPIALRFICDMAQHPALRDVPISGMGGIETWHDAAEFLMLGCGNLQITTAVMQYGYRIIDDLTDGLSRFMASHGYTSLEAMQGAALPSVVPADQLDRESICYPRFDRAACVGCGRCYTACADGGHQAIVWDSNLRRPKLKGDRCVGCHLCLYVCPAGAIGAGKRLSLRPAAAM